jgi:hypothetical protein
MPLLQRRQLKARVPTAAALKNRVEATPIAKVVMGNMKSFTFEDDESTTQ